MVIDFLTMLNCYYINENAICNITKKKWAEYGLINLPHGEYTPPWQRPTTTQKSVNNDLLSDSEDY